MKQFFIHVIFPELEAARAEQCATVEAAIIEVAV